MYKIPLITFIICSYLHKVHLNVVFSGTMEVNSAKVTFHCHFSIGSHDCSAEFLYNTVTLDNLRASNNKCYHKNKLCNIDTCSCSSDCKSFILNVSSKTFANGDIFGCEVHHIDYKYILSTKEEIIFNGSEFFYYNTSFGIIAELDRGSSLSPTEPNDVRTSKVEEYIIIALVAAGSILPLGIVLLFCVSRKQNQERLEHVSKASGGDTERRFRSSNRSDSLTTANIDSKRNVTSLIRLSSISATAPYRSKSRPRPFSASSSTAFHSTENRNVSSDAPLIHESTQL